MKRPLESADFSPSPAGGAAVIHPSADDVARRAGKFGEFVELTKPRLNFLVLVTTMVGYAMVPGVDWSDWRRLLHTLVGTALTAASASILNQYVERPFDALMHRTKRRPLPAGTVEPFEALILGVVTGVVGVVELYFCINPLTALLGAITLGSYVFVYTPLKRITTLNTIVGAVVGALPPMMGVTAAVDVLTPQMAYLSIALFGILFFWQMPHFLGLAIMYREDYARGGFKMLPVVDPELKATSRQMVFYAAALIPVTLSPTLLGVTGPIYFVAALALGLAFLGFALLCVRTRVRADARRVFLASILYLPVLLAAMMVDKQ